MMKDGDESKRGMETAAKIRLSHSEFKFALSPYAGFTAVDIRKPTG
jgi:hypothetical protein